MHVTWPSSLRFFERRYEVLRELEGLDLVRQFSVQEDRVAVRLGDANHQIAFNSSSFDAGVFRQAADLSRVETALRVVVDILAPPRVVRSQYEFKWLEPIEGYDYDSARAHAARSVFDQLGSNLVDFALLCDGEIADGQIKFRLESGVVQASEIPPRLAGTAGDRLGSGIAERIPVQPSMWPRELLPDVGFFCDTSWTPTDSGGFELSEAFDLWQSARVVAAGVVSTVKLELGFVNPDE